MQEERSSTGSKPTIQIPIGPNEEVICKIVQHGKSGYGEPLVLVAGRELYREEAIQVFAARIHTQCGFEESPEFLEIPDTLNFRSRHSSLKTLFIMRCEKMEYEIQDNFMNRLYHLPNLTVMVVNQTPEELVKHRHWKPEFLDFLKREHVQRFKLQNMMLLPLSIPA